MPGYDGERAEILKKLSYPDCHFVTEEEAEKLTEEEQKVFAGFSYMELADTYRQLTEELPVDQILCYVPDEDDLNHGLILFDGVKLEENLGTGAVRTEAAVSEDSAGNVTIKIVNPNQETVKDKTQNSVSANPDDTTETTAVGIWTDLSTKRKVAVGAEINARLIWRMLHNSGRYILYNLISIVVFTALVLYFLYLIVSRPLTKQTEYPKHSPGFIREMKSVYWRTNLPLLHRKWNAIPWKWNRLQPSASTPQQS